MGEGLLYWQHTHPLVHLFEWFQKKELRETCALSQGHPWSYPCHVYLDKKAIFFQMLTQSLHKPSEARKGLGKNIYTNISEE